MTLISLVNRYWKYIFIIFVVMMIYFYITQVIKMLKNNGLRGSMVILACHLK